jgi:hypothetical protein
MEKEELTQLADEAEQKIKAGQNVPSPPVVNEKLKHQRWFKI